VSGLYAIVNRDKIIARKYFIGVIFNNMWFRLYVNNSTASSTQPEAKDHFNSLLVAWTLSEMPHVLAHIHVGNVMMYIQDLSAVMLWKWDF